MTQYAQVLFICFSFISSRTCFAFLVEVEIMQNLVYSEGGFIRIASAECLAGFSLSSDFL